MPSRKSSQDRVHQLKRLASEPPDTESLREITHALALKNNHVVAAAAEVAKAWNEPSCVKPLTAAFDHFMADPAKRDPGCAAKVAVVEALHAIEHGDFDCFLRAARHVQREPVFGGSEDSATGLRVAGATALAELHYPEADFVLTDLLTDSEVAARRGAVHVLGTMGGRSAQALLRAKARMGDDDPAIVGMCLEGLMKIDGPASLEFVAAFLNSTDTLLIEQAALAIGEARLEESFPRLRTAWENFIRDADREMLLLGIALARSEDAFEFLTALVQDARPAMAVAAIDALSIYRGDPTRAIAIRQAASTRTEPQVRRALATRFEET